MNGAKDDVFRAGAPGPSAEESPGDLANVVDGLLASYAEEPRAQHIGKRFMPARSEILEILELLIQLFYPGYFGRQDLTSETIGYHVGTLLSTLRPKLERQIELCLCYRSESGGGAEPDVPRCRQNSRAVAGAFLAELPALRRRLVLDVQAAYDGDPAATTLDEVVLAYPGLLAITVYRIAHTLHRLGVPLMPRIMTEWAHTQTGADIHPGAEIGESFFLDHSTGAVVGETAHIGARVKFYQGVTLGAISIPRDGRGRAVRGARRHPTVEDDVTIYANATVLGGDTVLGRGSVVGGSVFITRSIPPGYVVALDAPQLRMASPKDGRPPEPGDVDFDI